MKVQILFARYDLWIGAFYDKKKNWMYILPLPMIGIVLKFPENWRISYVVRMWRLPNYGTCLEGKSKRATHDYNGHKHYVCDRCNDRLNRQFDSVCSGTPRSLKEACEKHGWKYNTISRKKLPIEWGG